MSTERLDKLLVQSGFADSRTQAQRMIAAGAVRAKLKGIWIVLDKPSQKFPVELQLETAPIAELKFVSRAGLKLDRALEYLVEEDVISVADGFDIQGKLVLDVGQSTGGFTDCLLQHGAAKVVGIDVGHGQLVNRLRCDPRVVCMEGINGRNLPQSIFSEAAPQGFDFAVMDVSFISQTLLLPAVAQVLKPGAFLLSLVKPQFEVGRSGLAKGGVVKNEQLFEVVERRINAAIEELSLSCIAYFASALLGSDGNREYFVLARKPPPCPAQP